MTEDTTRPGAAPGGTPVGREGTKVDITERPAWHVNGFLPALLAFALFVAGGWLIVAGAIAFEAGGNGALQLAGSVLAWLVWLVLVTSLTIIAPGDTKVVQFFGRYVGTIRKPGLAMTVPLSGKKKVSVKVHNFETHELKVNDADGNPINIASIVVWQVADTAKALFAVEEYTKFVKTQAESALRHVAMSYPYDAGEETTSLRGDTDFIMTSLAGEVAQRVSIAGLEIVEVRISSLAYAPEIAQAMLRRQQASAVIAAREKIVDGAVGMVENALRQLERDNIVDLDEERKAAMVSNLLVVLCSESNTTPVVNAGGLYT